MRTGETLRQFLDKIAGKGYFVETCQICGRPTRVRGMAYFAKTLAGAARLLSVAPSGSTITVEA